jgi:hypothetical protein
MDKPHRAQTFAPALQKFQMMRGCGRWTQPEWSSEVSFAIIDFLRSPPS